MNARAERHLRTVADEELVALVARLRRQVAALKFANSETGARARAYFAEALTLARLELERRTTV